MSSTAPAPTKFPLHLWSTHVHVPFASVENSVMSVTEKGFEERTATVFEKKRQTMAMLITNFPINWIYLELSCFYFPQMPRKMTKFCLNDMFENMKLLLKRASSGDQIKSSMFLCFSPCSFTFKSLRCYTMSPKIHQFPFIVLYKRSGFRPQSAIWVVLV